MHRIMPLPFKPPRLAAIVRGADTDRHGLTPQSAGRLAISMGLRDLIAR